MSFEQDYIMRQIQMLIQAISSILFQKDIVHYEVAHPQQKSDTDLLYERLNILVAQKRIGEAEDALFEQRISDSNQALLLAITFYQTINALSNDTLDQAGFPRSEIETGLRNYLQHAGYNLEI